MDSKITIKGLQLRKKYELSSLPSNSALHAVTDKKLPATCIHVVREVSEEPCV